jgi:hypothetical protein
MQRKVRVATGGLQRVELEDAIAAAAQERSTEDFREG